MLVRFETRRVAGIAPPNHNCELEFVPRVGEMVSLGRDGHGGHAWARVARVSHIIDPSPVDGDPADHEVTVELAHPWAPTGIAGPL